MCSTPRTVVSECQPFWKPVSTAMITANTTVPRAIRSTSRESGLRMVDKGTPFAYSMTSRRAISRFQRRIFIRNDVNGATVLTWIHFHTGHAEEVEEAH